MIGISMVIKCSKKKTLSNHGILFGFGILSTMCTPSTLAVNSEMKLPKVIGQKNFDIDVGEKLGAT